MGTTLGSGFVSILVLCFLGFASTIGYNCLDCRSIQAIELMELIPFSKNVATIKLLGGVKRRVVSSTQSVRCVAPSIFTLFEILSMATHPTYIVALIWQFGIRRLCGTNKIFV